MIQKIQFNSEGLGACLTTCTHLLISLPPTNTLAILVGGSWTTVKEQMSGLYASALADKGYVTLAIDPRNFW